MRRMAREMALAAGFFVEGIPVVEGIPGFKITSYGGSDMVIAFPGIGSCRGVDYP